MRFLLVRCRMRSVLADGSPTGNSGPGPSASLLDTLGSLRTTIPVRVKPKVPERVPVANGSMIQRASACQRVASYPEQLRRATLARSRRARPPASRYKGRPGQGAPRPRRFWKVPPQHAPPGTGPMLSLFLLRP